MASQPPNLSKRRIAMIAIGVVVFISLFTVAVAGWEIVDDGERGVHTRMGEVQGTVEPGFHLKIPLVDQIHTYEVRSQAYTMSSTEGEGNEANRDDSIKALTSEGLEVHVDMTTRYHIEPDSVDEIYTTVSTNQDGINERIVRPTAREAVRGCSAQYPVEGIYSEQRDEFGECVDARIRAQYESKGLTVEAVQIRGITLPAKVRNAIEDKQSAQERIETKEKELEIEELEKNRRIIEAEGISESQLIINESLSQQYLQYLFIEEGLEKGDPIYVPISNDGLDIYKDVDKTNPQTNSSSSGN